MGWPHDLPSFILLCSIGGSPETAQPRTIPCSQAVRGVMQCTEYSEIWLNLTFESKVVIKISLCTLWSRSTFQNLEGTMWLAKVGKGMLFSIEQAFVRSDEIRAPLKTSAWEANLALPCEQWFLQAGHCASMAKKPLRAFAFPLSMRVHLMTTNIQWQDGNENFNKTIGLISKTTTLHVYHAFIFAFLCHFCTTTTWRCLILRFMDNVNKQRRNLFFFSLLNLDMVPWNSTPFGFAYIWQSK